jgi:hypothetical protein
MPEQFAPTHGAYGGTMGVGVAIEPAGKELMLVKRGSSCKSAVAVGFSP